MSGPRKASHLQSSVRAGLRDKPFAHELCNPCNLPVVQGLSSFLFLHGQEEALCNLLKLTLLESGVLTQAEQRVCAENHSASHTWYIQTRAMGRGGAESLEDAAKLQYLHTVMGVGTLQPSSQIVVLFKNMYFY